MRSQDTIFMIAGVTTNAVGRELAWNFVKENYTEFERRYAGLFLLQGLLRVRLL